MASYQTANRTRILDYLKQHENQAVSAAELHRELAQQDGAVNISTVYRFLDKLSKDGTVLRYSSETGEKALYQFAQTGRRCQEHLHLKCVRCGAVSHLDCGFMQEIASHIASDHGFQLQCENSVLYGLCRRCQQQEKHL